MSTIAEKLDDFLFDEDRITTAQEAEGFILPPDELMNDICARVHKATGAELVFVTFVLDEKSVVKANYGMPDHLLEAPIRDSICTYVACQGTALVFPDPTTASMLNACAHATSGEITFYAGAPIKYKGHTIGSFGVASTDPKHKIKADRVLKPLRSAAQDIELLIRDRSQKIA